MAIIGGIIKKGISIANNLKNVLKMKPEKWQRKTLIKLLKKAKKTEFGKEYNFEKILKYEGHKTGKILYNAFKNSVPIHDYNKIYNEWWVKAYKGKKNITWPGKVNYFALSSGTSEAASKAIPVTNEMIKAIHRTSIAQIVSLGYFTALPKLAFEKSYLMIGGCTMLNPVHDHFEGDLSGITIGKMPKWFEGFFKPGKAISQEKNWETKLEIIAEKASEWDIAFIGGGPAWILILLEKIIKYNNVSNIHQIWPNLVAFGWGGVAIDPYMEGFSKLLDPKMPFFYLETYLASEGFMAYQTKPNGNLQMVLNNGIFYEFIPFSEENFDEDWNLRLNPKVLTINEVNENIEYALLLTTCAGAWRYLLGDTIKFVDKKNAEIVITGRTKHFMSLCGEHLSVDNMNRAILEVCKELGLIIQEFTLIGKSQNSYFTHQWFIGCDQKVEESELAERIDKHLQFLNDDYLVEREHALKHILVKVLPSIIFLNWMKKHGKMGGQNKFPRVLKGKMAEDWEMFVK